MDKFLGVIFIIIISSAVYAQTLEEFAAKSAFMVKMAHFVTWPDNSNFTPNSSVFTICVEGPRKYFSSLEEWRQSDAGSIKNKPAVVKYIDQDLSKLNDCNMLFIAQDHVHELASYLKVAAAKRFLTFADTPGYAERGVIVNFLTTDGSLHFEINLDVARAAGFSISPRLLKLATVISSDTPQ